MTSANLLIVMLVATAVGALIGLVAGPEINGLYLAILSGLLGTICAGIARNLIVFRGAGAGVDASRTPVLVIVYSVRRQHQ